VVALDKKESPQGHVVALDKKESPQGHVVALDKKNLIKFFIDYNTELNKLG